MCCIPQVPERVVANGATLVEFEQTGFTHGVHTIFSRATMFDGQWYKAFLTVGLLIHVCTGLFDACAGNVMNTRQTQCMRARLNTMQVHRAHRCVHMVASCTRSSVPFHQCSFDFFPPFLALKPRMNEFMQVFIDQLHASKQFLARKKTEGQLPYDRMGVDKHHLI